MKISSFLKSAYKFTNSLRNDVVVVVIIYIGLAFIFCLKKFKHLLQNSFFFFLQQSDDDVSQFDSHFTRQTPVDSPDDTTLSDAAANTFAVQLNTHHCISQ